MSDPGKILVIKLGALGDFVQALGPMAAIRRHHPQADITLLTTEPFVSMATATGYFNHIQIDDKPKLWNPSGWLDLRKRLNKPRYERVYDLQNNDRTAIYFRLFRPRPEWVGAVKGASHRNDSPARTAGHAFDGHVQTLKLAGITDITIDDMSWVKGDISPFSLQKPYVLLVPGCSPQRPEKRWGAEKYGTLARTLYGWGYSPVVIGTAAEKHLAAVIRDQCPQTVDLTGQTAIFDIVLLARDAAAAIGNDTGPMHLIAPTGCPSYVLFSAFSDPARHAPLGAAIHIIRAENLDELTAEQVTLTLKAREFRHANHDSALSSGQ